MLVEGEERLTCSEVQVVGELVFWVAQEEQLICFGVVCFGVVCWWGEELACQEELGVVC